MRTLGRDLAYYLVISGFLLYRGKKKQRTIEGWDQQNYIVIGGFCYIQSLYNKVPLFKKVVECTVLSGCIDTFLCNRGQSNIFCCNWHRITKQSKCQVLSRLPTSSLQAACWNGKFIDPWSLTMGNSVMSNYQWVTFYTKGSYHWRLAVEGF